MQTTLKAGIIGFGFIGKVHAFGYHNMSYFHFPPPVKTELFGVCNSREETAKKAKENFGFKIASTDYREIINHPEIDIINICSPNHLHKEQLIEAIKAKKHIYCDKPLVQNYEEAEEIEELLESHDKTRQMTFHLRFYPAALKAKMLIEEGSVGKIISFRFSYLHSGSVSPDRPMGWKQKKEFGGGTLNDLGSHAIDLCYHLLGDFREVSGISRILYPERPDGKGGKEKVEAEDLVLINARLKNGAIGSIEASKTATGAQDEFSFEIYGTESALRYNSMNPNFLKFYNRSDPDEPAGGNAGFKDIVTVDRYPGTEKPFPGPKFSTGWLRGHTQCLYNFLRAIKEGKQASPSFHEGIYNMKVIEAVKRSEEEGRWVSV